MTVEFETIGKVTGSRKAICAINSMFISLERLAKLDGHDDLARVYSDDFKKGFAALDKVGYYDIVRAESGIC